MYLPHPTPILPPDTSDPAAVPGYSHNVPSGRCAMTSEIASAVQVPAVKSLEKPPKPTPAARTDVQPPAPFPAESRSAPVAATTDRTSAFRSPLKSRGKHGVERGLVGMNHSERRPNAKANVAPLTDTEPAEPSTATVSTRPPHWPCPSRLTIRSWR